MPFVRMMRMLSAMESGQLSGAALEALLQEPGRAGELQVLIADRTLRKRILASLVTMAALSQSSAGATQLFANTQAVADLMASEAALGELLKFPAGKMGLFNSSAALTKALTNTATLAILRNAPGAVTLEVSAGNANATLPGTVAGGSYLLLGASSTHGNDQSLTLNTRVQGAVNPLSVSRSSGTTGMADAFVMALSGPVTVTKSSSGVGINYFRALRCDI